MRFEVTRNGLAGGVLRGTVVYAMNNHSANPQNNAKLKEIPVQETLNPQPEQKNQLATNVTQ